MTEDELKAIEERLKNANFATSMGIVREDMPKLVAEVRALQKDFATLVDVGAIVTHYWNGIQPDADRALREIAAACGMDVSDWEARRRGKTH